MKLIDSSSPSVSTAKTSMPRKGLRTGVRAGLLPTSDHCPRVAAPPVLQTSIQWPYE